MSSFFGKAAIDANLTVKGQGSKSVMDGSVKVDSGSNITVYSKRCNRGR